LAKHGPAGTTAVRCMAAIVPTQSSPAYAHLARRFRVASVYGCPFSRTCDSGRGRCTCPPCRTCPPHARPSRQQAHLHLFSRQTPCTNLQEAPPVHETPKQAAPCPPAWRPCPAGRPARSAASTCRRRWGLSADGNIARRISICSILHWNSPPEQQCRPKQMLLQLWTHP